MQPIKTEFLFSMSFGVSLTPFDVGPTPLGTRRITPLLGGTFEGPKMKGIVEPGGTDWLLNRPDGVAELDVRKTLRTDDGALIGIRYKGFRHGPKDVMERMVRGESVEPHEYYFRVAPFFEPPNGKYEWLNRVVGVGTGIRTPTGPVFYIYEVL